MGPYVSSLQLQDSVLSYTRPPLPEVTYSDPDINLFNLSQIEALPALADQMQVDTVRDPLLSKVIQYVRDGRPSLVPDELKLYRIRRNKPSIECNSFFWGIRVLIPSQLPIR